MKNSFYLMILLLTIFSLSACKPTEEDIQFALFQTEIAKQTYASPNPSATSTSTITPTPKIPLRDLVISLDDIDTIIPDAFKSEKTEVDLNVNDVKNVVDIFTGWFWGEPLYPNLSLLLMEYDTNGNCLLKLNYEKSTNASYELISTGNIELPSNTFIYEGIENNVIWLDFCQSQIYVNIGLYIPIIYVAREYVVIAEAYAQKQYLKLEEAGY